MKDLKSQKAIIYCRVSTKEQVEEGNSLVTQERLCREYANKHDFEIDKVFIESGESAKSAERTKLKEMLAYCSQKKHGIGYLIAYKIDRISRNTDDYSQIRILLKRYGVEIRSTTEHFENNPVGRFMENTMANIAQFDNDIRTERSVGGMKEAVSEGRYVWKAPLGYRNIRINGKATIEIDPIIGPIIKNAFYNFMNSRDTNVNIQSIIEIFQIKGAKSQRLIPKSSFYYMLRNPIYAGVINQFGLNVKGAFKPLISNHEFEYIQRKLKRNNGQVLKYKSNHPDFPLRRFVFHVSGKALTGAWSTGRNAKYPYYSFQQKGTNFRKEDFERMFVDFMNSFSLKENAVKYLEKTIQSKWQNDSYVLKRDKEKIEKELKDLKGKQDFIMEKSFEGKIPESIMSEKLQEIDTQKMELESQLYRSQEKDLTFTKINNSIKNFLKNPGKFWENSSLEVKLKIQRFEFPEGIVFEENKFRTNKISSIFKVNELFYAIESKVVHPEFSTSNQIEGESQLLYVEIDKIRSELRSLNSLIGIEEDNC